MGNHRFTPFKWHKKILVPCWIVQLSFLLFLFIIAMWDYVKGFLVATRAVLVLLELLSLVLILHETILFIRLSTLGGPSSSNIATIIRAPLFILTPTNYLVFQVLKTFIWSLLFSAGAWLTLDGSINDNTQRGLLTMLPNGKDSSLIPNFPDSYLGLTLHGILLALFLPSLVYASVMFHIFRRARRRDNATVTSRPLKSLSYEPPTLPEITFTHELPDTPTHPPTINQPPPSHLRHHKTQPSTWQIQLPEAFRTPRPRSQSAPQIHELSAVKSVPNSKPTSKVSSKPSSKRVTRTLAHLASIVANRSPWQSKRTSRHVEEGLWEDGRMEEYPVKVIDEYVDDTDDESEEEDFDEEDERRKGDGTGFEEGGSEEKDLEAGMGTMAWPLTDDSVSNRETDTVSSVSNETAQREGTWKTVVSPLTEKGFGGMF